MNTQTPTKTSPIQIPPVDFNATDVVLKKRFLTALTETKNPQLIILKTIIETNSNIKVKFSVAIIDSIPIYLVMITCHLDRILITLGKKYKFPRGFPILWIPSKKTIQTFGFYPKFENDAKEQYAENDASFANIKELNFFVKWSGYLGQLCPFKVNGKNYWTVTSKNSASATIKDKNGESKSNFFVQDAKRIWQPFINKKTLQVLVHNQLHICAEMLSKGDQVHGAMVIQEGPLVTAIGKGILHDGEEHESLKNPFVDFLPLNLTVRFCQRIKFMCGTSYQYKGKQAKLLMKQISSQRDKMDYRKFIQIISTVKGQHLAGTTNHAQRLGNILEGLVIQITNNDDSKVTKKYKFPFYTLRTMCLRTLLKSEINLTSLRALTEKFYGYRDYCTRWCVSNLGREYILEFLLECSLINKEKDTLIDFNQDPAIGLHIRLADYVMTHGIRKNVKETFLQHTVVKNLANTVIMDPFAKNESIAQISQQLDAEGYSGFTVVSKPSRETFNKLIIITRSADKFNPQQLQALPHFINQMKKKVNPMHCIETTIQELRPQLDTIATSSKKLDLSIFDFTESTNHVENKHSGKLFVMATGIPGSGKSWWSNRVSETLNAQGIKTVNLAQDEIFVELRNKWLKENHGKEFNRKKMGKNVSITTKKRFEQLFYDNTPVVISSRNNFIERDRKPFIDLARKYNYRVISIDPVEKSNPKEWVKLYLVSLHAVHQRKDHPTLNYFDDDKTKLATILQSFTGEYTYPKNVDNSIRVKYLNPGSYAGLESFDLDAEAKHLKTASFRNNALSPKITELAKQSKFPDELSYNRNPTMVNTIVDIIKKEYQIQPKKFTVKVTKLKPNFDKSNIHQVTWDNLPLVVPMFRYTHLRKGPRTFTPQDAKKSKFTINPNKVMYVAYVVQPETYTVLKEALHKLLPKIPLQTHFHMTIGFYGSVKPNINLENLPAEMNCTISQILATNDNGLSVAKVVLDPVDKEKLEKAGVEFNIKGKDKHLHLTLGTNLDYKPFHSNTVLESWFV